MTAGNVKGYALRWLDGEIARLKAERAAIAGPARKMTPARAVEVRKKIIAGRKGKLLHWTQRPENKAKLARVLRVMAKAKHDKEAAA
jgi:hypothetical protein